MLSSLIVKLCGEPGATATVAGARHGAIRETPQIGSQSRYGGSRHLDSRMAN